MNNQNSKKITMKKENTEGKFQICVAETLEEKEIVFQFRYSVYVEEMEKYKLKSQDKQLSDQMDEWATLIYVKDGEKVIATVRLNIGKIKDFPEEVILNFSMQDFQQYYSQNDVDYNIAYVSKLMIDLEYRNSPVLYLILVKLYEVYFEEKVQFSFAGCSLHLLKFYEKMGYHRYGANFYDFSYGLISPIVMLVNDLKYFRDIHSPFFRIARKKANIISKEIEWFYDEVIKNSSMINSQSVTLDELWSILCQSLSALPNEVIEILRDLSEEEAKKFLHACSSIVQCAPGEIITTQGDVSYSHYVLLSGSLKSLTFENPIREYTIPGQYFGANGLTEHNKHTEDIVTTSQAEILVLTGFAFPRFSSANLDIAHKIIKRSIALSRNTMIRFK